MSVLGFLLILIGCTGIHSVTMVSKLSVKVGETISIPCLYDSKYRNNVKYLCQGYRWNFCSNTVNTDNPERFSISDDKIQSVFTVTIRELTDRDTDYWCNVKKTGPDDGEYFHMTVTSGIPNLRVDQQELIALNGKEIAIKCYYSNPGEVKWCRLGHSCVVGSSGVIDKVNVSIDTSVSNVFTVTMSGLTLKDSGWYWCAKGDLQMPVRVTVAEKPTTNPPKSCLTTSSPIPDTEEPKSDIMSFVIPLCLLVVAIMMMLFIWFLLKRYKHTQVGSSGTTTEVNSNTDMNSRMISRQESNAEMEHGSGVVYSTVTAGKPPTLPRVELKHEDVTYSVLAYNSSAMELYNLSSTPAHEQ